MPTFAGSWRKLGNSRKNISLCFIDYAKDFDCVVHNKLWRALKEVGVPDHLTCLLRNLYVGPEATVITLYGTTDWFRIEKRVQQGICCHPVCLIYTLSTSNARLDDLQAVIKTGGKNINNLRYADDSTLTEESKEELKSLLMRAKEESKGASLKLDNKKTKTVASGPITSWQIEGGKVEVVTDFLFLGSKITADGDCSHEIRRQLLLGRKAMANLDSALKSRDITLSTKVHIVKAMVFPVVTHGYESCHKEGREKDY